MSRNTEYKFVETDSASIEARLVASYEKRTKRTLKPADPDRVFLSWVANAIVQERVSQNYVGNQNLPSRAEGENLDALGQWIYNIKRTPAQPSKSTVRFHISKAQKTAIPIPRGTRVTTASGSPIWYTTEDAVVAIGNLYADIMVQCETAGDTGNGYVAGQINTLIDVDNILYFASCENIDTASGGANEATDDQYYELMREGLDAYSTAGPSGAYIYHAKSVSSNIADVKAIMPRIQTEKIIRLYTDSNGQKHGFFGGEHLLSDTLTVETEDGNAAVYGEDYSCSYEDRLLDIQIIPGGGLADKEKIQISVDEIKAGYVYLYALMNDGTIADSVTKAAILSACNQDTVRPLTDFVCCKDAEMVDYNVNLTYWVDRNTTKSLVDIEADVTAAVQQFTKWQSEKIGRDINPSYLAWLLKDVGIKRIAISEPVFTALRNGDDHGVPQVARIGEVNIVNGGFEDE